MMKFIDKNILTKDQNGIWISKIELDRNTRLSQKAWEKIYDYDLKQLLSDRKDFNESKLRNHLKYILDSYNFSSQTNYLEIGCGPSHVGDYLMKKFDINFIGVDFNYKMLLTLKKYFEIKNYKKFTLIHADINRLPITNNSVDYIYGGGVIEHFSDTRHILNECYRVLRNDGVAFNTVPSFNLWWLTRFYNNIPSSPALQDVFEYIHLKLFKGKILEKYYGYELSYSPHRLVSLYKNAGFNNIKSGPFPFYPSNNITRNEKLKNLYYKISNHILTCPVLFISGDK